MKKLSMLALLLIVVSASYGQNTALYNVYAIKIRENGKFPAIKFIDGAIEKESVQVCNMFWLLDNQKDKKILIDAGFIDTTTNNNLKYISPEIALQKLNISPSEITDIIITHPHFDHIGGIHLFPNAMVWIQKNDFYYFVGEAWQESGFSDGFNKEDVIKLIQVNLDGRLKLIEGDNLEIIPGIKVFTGSKHTFENQYVLVNTNMLNDRILIASDAVWFYYNLNNILPIRHYLFDSKDYVNAIKRMKTLVENQDMIIPGHDNLLFLKFPEIKKWIVKIEN